MAEKTTEPSSQTSRTSQGGASMAPLASAFGLSPFSIVRRLMDEMDRMLEEFGSGRGFGPEARVGESSLQRGGLAAVWSPAIEAFERDGQFVVRADLPGLAPEDVSIETTKARSTDSVPPASAAASGRRQTWRWAWS